MSQLDRVIKRLQDAGLTIRSEVRLPDDVGTRLRLDNGASINVFDDGKVKIGGESNAEAIRIALGMVDGQPSAIADKGAAPPAQPRRVASEKRTPEKVAPPVEKVAPPVEKVVPPVGKSASPAPSASVSRSNQIGSDAVKRAIQRAAPVVEQQATTKRTTAGAEKSAVGNKVLVVYGHDRECRSQLESLLDLWNIEPLSLDELPTRGQTVLEKLEAACEQTRFGIVLATPDDEGHRAGLPDEKVYRVRQNVVLELGMLLASLGRENVVVLVQTQEDMDRPADIRGLKYLPFTDDLAADAGVILRKTMVSRGYRIDPSD